MNNLIKIVALSLAVVSLGSCEDFMDRHKQFISDGEIIYAPKIDSLLFYAGIDRIMLRCWLLDAVHVQSIDVYWNNDESSKIVPVHFSPGLDSVDIYLNNMGENSYAFKVQTTNTYGNHSLKSLGFAASYGALYESSIANVSRNAVYTSFTGNAAAISWETAPAGLVWSEVEYQTKSNETKTVKVMPNQSSLTCPDAQQNPGFFRYRPVFMPEALAVDTVYGAWHTWNFPKTSLWMMGSATTAGNYGDRLELTYNPETPWIYTLTTALKGGDIKFLATKNGINEYCFRPLVEYGSILDTAMQVYRGNSPDVKWYVIPSEAGTYKVTLNLNTMTILFEKQ